MVETTSEYICSSYYMIRGKKREKIIDSRFILIYFKYNDGIKFIESILVERITTLGSL